MVRMDTHLKKLNLITNDESTLLNAGGINDMDDLWYLKYANIQSLLIGSTTVTWRKIERVALFIDGGETVRTVTTMADITKNLRTGGVPSFTAMTSTASTHMVDPSRGAPKLHVNALKEFYGQPINYEDWDRGFKATLGQTAYATLITTPPTTRDTIMETRDKELFFVLTSVLMKGSGMHIINAMNNESGHQAIQEIETWYGSDATSRTIIDHYRYRLKGIKLTEETTASSYVNEFLICSSKLEKKREGYTAATKQHNFLDQIKDDYYDVVKQQQQGDTSIDFDTCVNSIIS